MKKPKYKLVNRDLQLLIRYKKQKGDIPLPNQRKKTLQNQWNAIKQRPSPYTSPVSSDVEDESDLESEVNSLGSRYYSYSDDEEDEISSSEEESEEE